MLWDVELARRDAAFGSRGAWLTPVLLGTSKSTSVAQNLDPAGCLDMLRCEGYESPAQLLPIWQAELAFQRSAERAARSYWIGCSRLGGYGQSCARHNSGWVCVDLGSLWKSGIKVCVRG